MKKLLLAGAAIGLMLGAVGCGDEAGVDGLLASGKIDCTYSAEYDKSVVYMWIDAAYAGGLTGEWHDGNVCEGAE